MKESPIEISPEDAFALRNSKNPPLFLDVREEEEIQVVHLQPDLWIRSQDMGERLHEIPTNQPIIIYCHHGMRSLHFADFLRQKGFLQVYSLAGGVDQWARNIDPSLNRY